MELSESKHNVHDTSSLGRTRKGARVCNDSVEQDDLPIGSRPHRVLLSHEEKKKRLFKKSKPFVRNFDLKDLWVLYAAYDKGGFPEAPQGLTRVGFDEWMMNVIPRFSYIQVIEDNNKKFKHGRGIVCVVAVKQVGTVIEPNAMFMPWATKSNILRACVNYFNLVRYNKSVSSCVVGCLDDAVNLLHHVKRYGVLFYGCKIVNGNPSGVGHRYIFSVTGKFGKGKKCL